MSKLSVSKSIHKNIWIEINIHNIFFKEKETSLETGHFVVLTISQDCVGVAYHSLTSTNLDQETEVGVSENSLVQPGAMMSYDMPWYPYYSCVD